MDETMKFDTKAVHAGVKPDPSNGAIMTPIFQSSSFVQSGLGAEQEYVYARSKNPTRTQVQDSIAALENGKHGLVFGSGMAAIDAVVKLFKPGDQILSINALYGGTHRLFTQVYAPFGIDFKFIDMEDAHGVEEHIVPQTKMIWIETPTNPSLSIVDIEAIAVLASGKGILLAVDNTFATPYLQNPLDLGADIVMHSATKYLGGHSDTLMGALVVKDDALAKKLYALQNNCGAISGPFDCFLVLRGIKTLHLRMRQHCINAMSLARYLEQHPKVGRVNYPGLEHHPNHHIAKKQMRDFGGMLSFVLKNEDQSAAEMLISKLKVFTLAESLGGVESLIGHPATMTHASLSAEERAKAGITDGLLRLSVGVEDPEDIINDLEQALA